MPAKPISLDMIPVLDTVPAAAGAIVPPLQLAGGTVFDVVVSLIVVRP